MSRDNVYGKSIPLIHDSCALEDGIGHDHARDTLVAIINSIDSPTAMGSFTIGVYGEWGSGKTTMLTQVRNKLTQDNQICVWFNPWQFSEKGDVVHALLNSLAIQLSELENDSYRLDERVLPHLKRLSGALFKAGRASLKGLSFKFSIPFLAEASVGMNAKDITDKATETEIAYYRMIESLKEASSELDRKIIVFIDDLDRCPPGQAIDLLDGMKILFDIPNFVFVIAVAHEVLERAIRRRYEDFFKGDDEFESLESNYLHKIIQFSFELPMPNAEKVKTNIIRPRLSELSVSAVYDDVVLKVVGVNPRSLKRFLNVVTFNWELAKLKITGSKPTPELVLKASLIAYSMPKVHKLIERYPSAIVDINTNIIDGIGGDQVDAKSRVLTNNTEVAANIEESEALLLLWILEPDAGEAGFLDRSSALSYISLASTSIDLVSKTMKDSEDEGRAGRLGAENNDLFVTILAGEVEINKSIITQITHDFLISVVPVTQKQYIEVVGINPSTYKGDWLPVENVSWVDAIRYCNKLSEKENLDLVYSLPEALQKRVRPGDIKCDLTKNGYRLPSESEWMLAAGSAPTPEEIETSVWHQENSQRKTWDVSTGEPNINGVRHMFGNVWEWCHDWTGALPVEFSQNYYGPDNGTTKVVKGGSWSTRADIDWVTHQAHHDIGIKRSNIGFRVVRAKM